MYYYLLLLFVALGAAGISFTITFTGIFKPLREVLGKLHPKVDELMHCPWCFNHYVVFIILAISGLPLLPVFNNTFMDFLITAFTLIAIGGLVHYVLLRAYEPIMRNELARKMPNFIKIDEQED